MIEGAEHLNSKHDRLFQSSEHEIHERLLRDAVAEKYVTGSSSFYSDKVVECPGFAGIDAIRENVYGCRYKSKTEETPERFSK